MFDGNPKQYPNLVRFLNHFTRLKIGNQLRFPKETAGRVIAGVGLIALALPLVGLSSLSIVLGVVLAGAGIGLMFGRRVELTPEDEFMLSAQKVAATMQQCLVKRRLHRDLDNASLMLLEESCRHWARVQQAFQTSFWDAKTLPLHYQTVREQSLKASDRSMGEVMMLFQDQLPSQVVSRSPMDFVEEAVEKFVKPTKGDTRFAGPAFEPTRKIAEKLRTLADEAENVALETAQDPLVAPEIQPGTALDSSIGELRTIRQAEDELRQNLRG